MLAYVACAERLERCGVVILIERCQTVGGVDAMADAGVDELCGEVHLDVFAKVFLKQHTQPT